MDLLYRSTRDSSVQVTASQAILKGLSADGGLFVPNEVPALDVSLDELAKMSYQETAYAVMSRFLTDFTEEELKGCIEKAYDEKFDTPEIAPLVKADGAYFLGENGGRYFLDAPKGIVINTVGSGDSMVAGFLSKYLKGESLIRAACCGVAAGSARAFSEQLPEKEVVERISAEIIFREMKEFV